MKDISKKSIKTLYFSLIACLLCISLLLSTPVYAAKSTEESITDIEKQQQQTKDAINNIKAKQEDVQDNVDELSEKKKDLEQIYTQYAGQMDSINSEIEEAQAAISENSAAIVSINGILEETRAKKQENYEILQKCIQASYENKNHVSMIFSVLTSSSLKDFLSKAEYVSQILAYEQNLIDIYIQSEATLEEQSTMLLQKQTELDQVQNTLDEKQTELSNLADDAKEALDDTSNDLSEEKSKLKEYDKELANLDKKMKNLESQAAAAQAKLAQELAEKMAKQQASGTGSTGTYTPSGSDTEWLAATIQAEADGESYTGKLAVGSVIMNRVKSSCFPNSVVGVITQANQFASYRSGKVELIMSKGPNATCMQAAKEVLGGASVGNYYFFMTKAYADKYGIVGYTMIGNHAFFSIWKTKDTTQQDPATTTNPGDDKTTNPGTTDPGTTDPSTVDPGTTDPGTTDPGTTDPTTTPTEPVAEPTEPQ